MILQFQEKCGEKENNTNRAIYGEKKHRVRARSGKKPLKCIKSFVAEAH